LEQHPFGGVRDRLAHGGPRKPDGPQPSAKSDLPYPWSWYGGLYRIGAVRFHYTRDETRALHEWQLAAMLGYDLSELEGAPGSQAPADVQRAITERVARLRTLPDDVKLERQRRVDEYVALRRDPKRRREVSAGIGRAPANTRILDDTQVEVLKSGG